MLFFFFKLSLSSSRPFSFVLCFTVLQHRAKNAVWDLGTGGCETVCKTHQKKTLRDYITTPNNDPHPSAHNFYRQTKFPPTSSNLSRGSSAASSSTSLQTCNCIYTSSAVTQADYPIPLPRRQRVPEPDPRDTALCKRRRGSAGFRRSR